MSTASTVPPPGGSGSPVSIVARTLLIAWRDWLALKTMTLKAEQDTGSASPAARIELAALKERVRKLEAIASGVDLLP